MLMIFIDISNVQIQTFDTVQQINLYHVPYTLYRG